MNDRAEGNALIQCSCCGGTESIEMRFAACAATTHWRTIGPTGGITTHIETDDIQQWKIPLCMSCLPNAYEIFLSDSVEKTRQHLKACAIFLLFGVPVFIALAVSGPKSQPVILLGTVFGGFLVVALIWMFWELVRWISNSRRSKKFKDCPTIPADRIDMAFWGEGKRIIRVLLSRGKTDSIEAVYGTFPLPQHHTSGSLEDVKLRLKESKSLVKKGTEVRVDALAVDIVAVERTIQEIEKKLPQLRISA